MSVELEIDDRFGLIPPKIRDVIIGLQQQFISLITTEEVEKFRVQCVMTRVGNLSRCDKKFCDEFLPFLYRQNEDLRKIALAASGSFVDAIPDVKKFVEKMQHGNINNGTYEDVLTAPWKRKNYPGAPLNQTVDKNDIHRFISQWFTYADEFCKNITQKGRLEQVEEFVFKNFPISTTELRQVASGRLYMLDLCGLSKYSNLTSVPSKEAEKPQGNADNKHEVKLNKGGAGKFSDNKHEVKEKSKSKKMPRKEGETDPEIDPDTENIDVLVRGINFHLDAIKGIGEKIKQLQQKVPGV